MKSDETFSRFAYLTHEDLDFLQDPEFYRTQEITNSYQSDQSDYDDNCQSHFEDDEGAAFDDENNLNNLKEDASKSVSGTDFDKIIDIPAVNNEVSKEETKGGEKQQSSRTHK